MLAFTNVALFSTCQKTVSSRASIIAFLYTSWIPLQFEIKIPQVLHFSGEPTGRHLLTRELHARPRARSKKKRARHHTEPRVCPKNRSPRVTRARSWPIDSQGGNNPRSKIHLTRLVCLCPRKSPPKLHIFRAELTRRNLRPGDVGQVQGRTIILARVKLDIAGTKGCCDYVLWRAF